MAAILTPPTTSSTPRRRPAARRAPMPTLPFPAPVDAPTAGSIAGSIAGSVEGATARALHPAARPSDDPTVEIERSVLVGAAAHAGVASVLAPWNRADQRVRPAGPTRVGAPRHLHVVREAAPVLDRPEPTVHRARRSVRTLVGGVALAFVLSLAAVGALQFFGAAAAASTPAATTEPTATTGAEVAAAAAPVEAVVAAHREIVVERGDSVWTVARRLQPSGDLRRLVDRLIERNGGATVTVGQHLDVTGLVG